MDSARSSHAQHKEAMQSFIRQFLSHCCKVLSILQTNPYSYAEDQLKKINNTSFTFPEVIVRDVSKIFDISTGQYDEFVCSRFVLGSLYVISTPIPRNGLKLPKDAGKVALGSPQIKLKRLEDGCKDRNDLLDLFNKELITSLAHFNIYIWPIFK